MSDRWYAWLDQIAARDVSIVSMAGLALCAVVVWETANQWPGRWPTLIRVGVLGSFAFAVVCMLVGHLRYLYGDWVIGVAFAISLKLGMLGCLVYTVAVGLHSSGQTIDNYPPEDV